MGFGDVALIFIELSEKEVDVGLLEDIAAAVGDRERPYRNERK